jgi:hypothetical protein
MVVTVAGGGWAAAVTNLSPCPSCGRVGAEIPSGTWTVETIGWLLRTSAGERQALQDVVKVAVAVGVEEALRATERLPPEARRIAEDAILSPNQVVLLTLLGLLITVTGLLYPDARSEVNQKFDNLVERVIRQLYADLPLS